MTTSEVTNKLKAGEISLAEWQAQMKDLILAALIAALIIAKGGRDNVPPAAWVLVGIASKKLYGFIDGFAAEIKAEPAKWLTGNRINARANLYNQIGYVELAAYLLREHEQAGYTEERRVLGPVLTEHCSPHGDRPGCVDLAKKGWKPIGSLPAIGDAACWSNCKCRFQYRKPDGSISE